MITFLIALCALVAGYFFYGRFVEKIFSPDDRQTPAYAKADGVDFMPLPAWKIFMIQFLNIAGTGPIFGAIMGAWYGPIAYLWIVFGSIFAGAVHDYLSGMLSIRQGGVGLPELIGKYLGSFSKHLMLVFSVFLLIMVGVVFVYSPAVILESIWGSKLMWIIVIFVYYIIATMLPINRIIGRVYPLFAFSLLFMAFALLIVLLVKQPAIPELWTDLSAANLNKNPAWLGNETFLENNPVLPCLFITIACGAISGFHATQSPLMARCMKSEWWGRPIYYGAMITEGIVAVIWATISMYFFYYGGWQEVVAPEVVEAFIAQADGGKTLMQFFDAPTVVKYVCESWLGAAGGILAMLGVVAAPITSGDTAFRSARLIVADFIGLEQRSVRRRFYISIPMFVAAILLLVWMMSDPDGFNVIWQYFGWANQTLSVVTLWTLTVYLARRRMPYWIMLFPALLMTVVCSTFLLASKQALGLPPTAIYIAAIVVLLVAVAWFSRWYRKNCSRFV